MRIAIGGIAVECCSFSPLPTRLDDITRLRGDELHAEYPFLPSLPEAEYVPLIRGRATPGGPVERSAYEQIKQEFLDKLREGGPWDGVYLDMHGALYVLGMEDAEGDWTASVREVVGEDCMISASYDLHGNVSPRVMANVDLLTAYRTAPHRDVTETRERACRLLVHCLMHDVHPNKVFIPVPLLLPGEKAMTTAEPAGSLYARIPEVIEAYDLLDVSILVGYAWVDEPRATACVITLGEDAGKAQQAAEELARDYWSRREGFRFGMPTGTVDACIEQAQALPEKPVFISDAGDNITGGGIGDVPYCLDRLLAHGITNCLYAGIVDAAAVAVCFDVGTGAEVSLSLGGKLDTTHGTPFEVVATVLKLDDTLTTNRHAIIDVQGIQVILTERRTAFTTAAQFDQLGIDPRTYELVVIKLGYLFPEIAPMAQHALLALSPGAIDPAVENLPYEHVKHPIFPLDREMTWHP
ncbi:M81 family metallopeptidase [Phototrophicus methaneseepsis]|uniref:M81 family metallopeptidase n=1 Tax=Phototrophicus methaneseepsis TaxID=2710758 RepID=A0A7S8EAI0_9CHLR|nr:M81 family metallopeptidase [Phototrophicus methaneseepsis]QPC83360.1 M81 family metallopeptidase [Phototrophicus methaneseepsis]